MKITDKLINLVFPRTCVCCGESAEARFGYALCQGCGSEYEILKTEICSVCGRAQMECRCRPSVIVHGNIAYRHLIEYKSDLSKKIVFALKRKNSAPLRRFLASELCDICKISGKNAEIAYVPRKNSSIREYGFDQAKELALSISKLTGAKTADLFRHTKQGAYQKELGFEERRENAGESYVLNGKAYLTKDELIIIDDVITTGSTVGVLCELARIAGAERITVLTVAKTGMRRKE